ncbi:MAG: alpha-L-fucosidase [Ignavibacteriae bacterium]|nr:alpha-L-fucosidase [Ignavibacteriota bacterium]
MKNQFDKTHFNTLFLSLIIISSNIFAQSNKNTPLTDSEVLQKAVSVLPDQRQYEWQQNEFTAFIHFGVNTFTGREWGTGFEDPKIFNPTELNTDQWCEAIKSAGMKLVILTVKHHDGFCLWQTRYTDHSVKSSTWRNGEGDVLKDLAESCKKYDLKLGVYLSPADLYQIENQNGLYGNGSKYSERIIPRKTGKEFINKKTFKYMVDDYNEYFMNQLFELLTEYGPIYEVWFDGAHPKTKGNQQYTYNSWYELIRELAPQAVIFGKGPDVRWCGNEAGETRESEWSVIPMLGSKNNWTWPDMTDDDLGSINKIKEAIVNNGFLHWYPAETNTSIREGWFWRDEAQYVKSPQKIIDIWYRSVGGNTVFLLNIPPNNKGLFSDRDVQVLNKVGKRLNETFTNNLAKGSSVVASSNIDNNHKPINIIDDNPNTCWIPNENDMEPYVEIILNEKKYFNRILFQEQIQKFSQRISSFEIESLVNNEWVKISDGTTVGYKRICKTSNIYSDRVRIRILNSRLNPTINNFELFFEKVPVTNPIISRDKNGFVNISCEVSGPIIKYSIDGKNPNNDSKVFSETFNFPEGGMIKAIAYDSDNNASDIITKEFDICKAKWKVHFVSSEQDDNNEHADKAIDDDENTNWITQWRPNSPDHPHSIEIDLGEKINIKGFSYLPRKEIINGTIKEFIFYTSLDGSNWDKIIQGEFSNIKNNPVEQKILFQQNVDARFIKLESINEINGNPWASAAEIGIITK